MDNLTQLNFTVKSIESSPNSELLQNWQMSQTKKNEENPQLQSLLKEELIKRKIFPINSSSLMSKTELETLYGLLEKFNMVVDTKIKCCNLETSYGRMADQHFTKLTAQVSDVHLSVKQLLAKPIN